MLRSTIFFSLVIFISCEEVVDIEKYLKVCGRNSPDVNSCLVAAIQDALEVLSGGIEELGMPAVDPYYQKELRVDYKNQQIKVTMIANDVYVYGLRSAKVHNVRLRADEDLFHLEVDMTAAKVFIEGTYTLDGIYNFLQIKANGRFNTTMSGLVYTWKLDGKPEKIGDNTYVRIESFYMRPDLSDMKSYLSNENPDSKELTDLGINFANANWKFMYRELLPYALSNWNKIGVRICNKLFLKVPYAKLFPAN